MHCFNGRTSVPSKSNNVGITTFKWKRVAALRKTAHVRTLTSGNVSSRIVI